MVKNKYKLICSVMILFLVIISFFLGINFEYWILYGFQKWDAADAIFSALSAIALFITAIFIYKQASATKEMVEFQGTPRVDVGMRNMKPQKQIKNKDEEKMGTRFVVYNYTQAMVWVWKKIDLEIDGIKIDKTTAERWLGRDLLGRNPLPVKGASLLQPYWIATNSYDFLLNIDDIKNKKITATLEYWSAYTPEEQKNPKIFGPIPYYFDIERGWIIGGGWGMPF